MEKKLVFLSTPINTAEEVLQARRWFSAVKKKGKFRPMMPYLIAAEIHRTDLVTRREARLSLSEWAIRTMLPKEVWVARSAVESVLEVHWALEARQPAETLIRFGPIERFGERDEYV